MSSSSPAFLTACEASEAIQAGRLSPVDLVDALLDRIDAHEERLHAFAAVYQDEARAAAEAAHKAIRSGHGIGPWHGVPIALKDIIDIEGRITTIGSKHWKDRVSPTTATLARRLIEAGMIVIGKANTVEFAMGGWGTNRHMGTPRNPWDAEVHRAPGGSSSGSGVSVAARLAPWAIGTDTGGSVRIPSAWCGLAGLKVTIGQISTAGVAPLSHTLDTPGPMTRTVEDAARLYMVLQGPDPADPTTLRHVPADPLPALRRGVAGLRLGVMAEAERQGVDTDVLAAYDAAIEVLKQAGARCETLALPRSVAEYGNRVGKLIGTEGYFHVGALVDDEVAPHRRRRAPAHSAGTWRLCGRVHGDDARARRRQAGCARGDGGVRRPAHAGHADAGASGSRDRPEQDARSLHAHGQLAGVVRPRGAQRCCGERPADLAAHRLPRPRRGDGAPHRLGLRAGHRLAPARAPQHRGVADLRAVSDHTGSP